MRKELFEFRRVCKHSGGHDLVLDNLSLRLYQNEITFLIAPGGTRTAVTAMMEGMSTPESGGMRLLEREYRPTSPDQAHECGIYRVNAETALLQNLSLMENICLARQTPFIWNRRQAKILTEMLCREYGIQLDLSEIAAHRKEIEILMVFLLRALLVHAKILILDNVLYLLSDEEVNDLFGKLQLLRDRGVGILIAETAGDYARQYADRTVFFANGFVSADLTGEEYTREFEEVLLQKDPFLPSEAASTLPRNSGKTRSFYVPGEDGLRQLCLEPGEIQFVSCHSADLYQRCLDALSRTEEVKRINFRRSGFRVGILTYRRLQSDFFIDLSFAENVVLPAYSRVFGDRAFSPDRMEKFLRSELAGLISVPEEQWRNRLMHMGGFSRELSVLYRMLMEDTDILVLAGILDQPSIPLIKEVRKVALRAAEMGKCVLSFQRKRIQPFRTQDRTVFLDENGSDSHA